MTAGSLASSSGGLAGQAVLGRPTRTIISGSRVISAETNLRPSPCTTMWPAHGHSALKMTSIFCGATYLPPEVLIRSFLRSVIRR